MKYLLLIHHSEQVLNDLGESARKQLREESVRLANEIDSSGHYVDAAPLHPVSAAKCVRVRDGKPLVTDGPFAETREQLGGYFLIRAADINEAIEIAKRIPGGRIGAVEIREVVEVEGLPTK
jgi:hypothetical protein